MPFRSFLPDALNPKDLHQLIIGSVAPRPIALVSTVSAEGQDNLAPYSFFNAISSNPPLLMFSVSRSPEPRPQKDTLINLNSVRECVINIVDETMARQMSLCSVAFDHGVSEFEKSGLTGLESEMIRPKRVAESPVQFECTVKDILVYGKHTGAANVVLCEVKIIHVRPGVMMEDKLRIDPWRLESVGRLGRSYYVNVKGDVIFDMYQPVKPVCIGYDALPASARNSTVLSARDLAELASETQLPTEKEVRDFVNRFAISETHDTPALHRIARSLLEEQKKHQALLCVMIPEFKF